MKLPNAASLAALLLVVLPAVSVGIEQVFPAAEWYWSPLVVMLLGVAAKALQESLAKQTTPPAPGDGAELAFGAPMAPVEPPARWRRVLHDPRVDGAAPPTTTTINQSRATSRDQSRAGRKT